MHVRSGYSSLQKLLICFLIASILATPRIFAQNKVPIEWTWPNLLTSDSIWKYQAGAAKPEYFLPQFDDHNWKKVNDDFCGLYGDIPSWPGIGVFRKTFHIPDSLRGRQAKLLFLLHTGASEVYLDGKRIAKLGSIGDNTNNERVNIKLFEVADAAQFELDSQSNHILVIYHSNHSSAYLNDRIGIKGFLASVSPLSEVSTTVNDIFPHSLISMSIILSFALFFFFVFGFYPFRLASLVTALLIANFSLIFIGSLLRQSGPYENSFVLGDNLWRIGFATHAGWYILFLYSLFYNKMPKKSLITIALMMVGIWVSLYYAFFFGSILVPITIIFYLESWRMIVLGIIKKKTGFWIIAIGMLCSNLGTLVAIFDVFDLFPGYITNEQTVIAIITDLSFPLTLALQLAWEFGSANRDLRRQLVQVKDLSQKNSQQELEKQQILAIQNETLEKQVAERTSQVMMQKQEIEIQRDKVTGTLEELRSTQSLLIQSEKMASLGELTAGIAHEIQNPLNFVNNFSEVNKELLEEMNQEIEKGNMDEVKLIAHDIIDNELKINQHGKRAEAIVKGMLQHSRSSTGHKEPTDINAVADEYLRLSYHGLRAKDKSFNATMQTDFDRSIKSVELIQQDIGRVLLNLYNNAFYAVNDKKKKSTGSYEPTVTVTTKLIEGNLTGHKVQIMISDNGDGILPSLRDKIFQPFFTTKPTGQGTGLGLSLSYDIIKAHGGELIVESEPTLFTRFILLLPS